MADRTTTEYEYNGYLYGQYHDVEFDGDGRPENVKIWHEVKSPDGKDISMDWSPYDTPTYEQFALWVELGCPDRFALRDAGGPLDAHDLVDLNNKRRTEEPS